jgi:hypothetical protein
MAKRKWSAPIIEEVPHDSPEFWEILAALSVEDRAIVKSPEIGTTLRGGERNKDGRGSSLQLDEGHRPQRIVIGDDVPPARPWKRQKRDAIIAILNNLQPRGIPPRDQLPNPELLREVRAELNRQGLSASRKSILRAAGRER